MKIIVGKQVSGPKNVIPNIFMFGGMVFVNVLTYSFMIPMHQKLIDFLLVWGFNPYGD